MGLGFAQTDDRRQLRGKVAMVTGAGRGIGRAIAERLAGEGVAVMLAQRSRADADDVCAGLTSRGATAMVVECDVANDRSVAAAIDAGVAAFGGLDIIVNNAGVGLLRTAAETTDEEYERVFDTNVRSIFMTTRHGLEHLRRSSGGSIVNIGSVAGHVGFAADAAYCASKGAVAALTRQMALDLAPESIRVNCVEPGFIETDQLEEFVGGADDPDAALAAVVSMHPVGRLGRSDEVAAVAAFLASAEASFITGASIQVDGGLLIRP